MMGKDTYNEWENHYKDKHGIMLKNIPYQKKYRFGSDQVYTATEGVILPIMLANITAPSACVWSRVRPRSCCPRLLALS